MEYAFYILLFLMPVAAFFYASVGHGGASSYLMLLTLFNFAPEQIRPTALMLNIVVSFIAFASYRRTCEFKKDIFIPLVIFSIPAAYIGGTILVDAYLYKKILGVLLIFPALRFLNVFPVAEETVLNRKWWMISIIGLSIGFVSGLIGIGGGIILSPILLMAGWANVKETAALSALFIFLNSISGFIGSNAIDVTIDPQLWMLMPLTIGGGALGAYFGANKFNPKVLKQLLAAVLIIASVKFLIG
ncbi:sulfite exporter TauE/SafE family protein [Ignavibacteria bacterium CHB1]|nr:MAG: sulfite exporter TauE/SafE family protein [Chlorobiota bacterium]MBW7855216.1 sulfite exporter TauE/SafE family protein [Ignavibacteria bacterium]MCE7952723.1 sulfite exporter TauE/SafE family protein [Chlorobi bacterium CHB7]MDL1886833.1 sulfite exporter TauE/SafE family protein [Ignavibacteria bacterium CHB1]OQY77864.1 MAG: hypothetical protein B6D43_04960 [Ignavibacteriales bacterium UTCHB1]RIK50423.1 MAG: hypothetical protein DCC60_00730 [Ignavibacteriota bacterium]